MTLEKNNMPQWFSDYGYADELKDVVSMFMTWQVHSY